MISSVEEVIMRFANLSPQERAKRKLEGLEQLKRVFNKLGDDVNVEEHMQQFASLSVEEFHHQLHTIQRHCIQLQQRLSSYENFNTVKEAEDVERILEGRLSMIRSQKKMLESSQAKAISFSHGIGSQFYEAESLSSSAILKGNLKDNWRPNLGQQNILGLNKSSSNFPQRLHFGRHRECTEDQANYDLFCQWKDALTGHLFDNQNSEAQKQQKMALDMDMNGGHAAELGSENTITTTNNICSGSRKPLPWNQGSQTMSCDEVMHADPGIYQFPQQRQMGSTEESQSHPMHHQLDALRPQNSSVIIQSHHASHECSW